MNLFPVELDDGSLVGPGGLQLPAPGGLVRGAKLIAGVRPEAFSLLEGERRDGSVDCRVVSREALGDETIYVVDGDDHLFHVRMPPTTAIVEEQPVGLAYDGGVPQVYDPETGKAVGA